MNSLTEKYENFDDEGDYGTDEEAPQPYDGPVDYPQDLPVKLLQIKEWLTTSGEYSFTAYARAGTDGVLYCDIPGHLALTSGKYEAIWEYGSTQVREVRPVPSSGIARSSMRLPIHDAAQTVLGLEDAEAELLFYGEDLAGDENEALSLAFLDLLIDRTSGAFPGFHMREEDVQEFRVRWSREHHIMDPEEVWQEGQVSPKAFAA